MKISDEILNRKGAIKLDLVTTEIRNLLNRGLIASVNLTEWLSVDHSLLIKNVLPIDFQQPCIDQLSNLKEKTAMKSIPAVAKSLIDMGVKKDTKLFQELKAHTSDSVRCWSAYIVGLEEGSISSKLTAIKPFAADANFGVREIAWMAVRASVNDNINDAINILSSWTKDTDVNVRRFAPEATRPRGVWSKHIESLKTNPGMGLPILEPLKADKEKYVRDSVANWLNDASKTQPEFVRQLCKKWTAESPNKETAYIVKKALRSIR